MSYDICMTLPESPDRFTTTLSLGNYTSNCAAMWRLASPETDGLAGIDGKSGAEVRGYLKAAYADMQANPAKYEALNPVNGWGRYESAMEYLGDCAKAARKHPGAKFEVDR